MARKKESKTYRFLLRVPVEVTTSLGRDLARNAAASALEGFQLSKEGGDEVTGKYLVETPVPDGDRTIGYAKIIKD